MNQKTSNTHPANAVTTQPASTQMTPVEGLRRSLGVMTPEFAKVLPAGVTPEKFVRTVVTAAQANPDLAAPEVRSSFMLACMKAAADGLMPDGRESVLLIRNNKAKSGGYVKEVTYQSMVSGDIKFIRQRAGVKSVAARVVYGNESFLCLYGDGERIEHSPIMGPAEHRGEMVAAYVIALMENGAIEREVMTIEEIEAARAQSKQPDSLMWTKFYSEGAKKTVIRRLRKRLPDSRMEADYLDADDEFHEAPIQIGAGADNPGIEPATNTRSGVLQHIVDSRKETGADDDAQPVDDGGDIHDGGSGNGERIAEEYLL